MPRPKKCRRVCRLPLITEFIPKADGRMDGGLVVMTVDEYETIRLIDGEGFSQEDCGMYMDIARTTVQMIYDGARKKIARALIDGAVLRIEGGSYQLCDRSGTSECCQGCHGRRDAPHRGWMERN